MEKATILSPFDGVITERRLRAGFDVNRSDVLVQLLDTENLEVRLAVPLKYLAFTHLGNDVELSTKSDTGEIFSLKAFVPKIDGSLNFVVPAIFSNSSKNKSK